MKRAFVNYYHCTFLNAFAIVINFTFLNNEIFKTVINIPNILQKLSFQLSVILQIEYKHYSITSTDLVTTCQQCKGNISQMEEKLKRCWVEEEESKKTLTFKYNIEWTWQLAGRLVHFLRFSLIHYFNSS